MDTLKLNSSLHTRNMRFCDLNYITPRHLRKSEGGRTFLVNAIYYGIIYHHFLKEQSSVKSFNEKLCMKHFYP